jgi:RNase P subunit RPR2
MDMTYGVHYALRTAAIVEEVHGDLLQGRDERTPMKIRITVNQSADRSPCAHRDLTLAGRSMRLQGLALKRSTERYTCNACGKPLVRTFKTSWSSRPAPNHHTTELGPFDTES